MSTVNLAEFSNANPAKNVRSRGRALLFILLVSIIALSTDLDLYLSFVEPESHIVHSHRNETAPVKSKVPEPTCGPLFFANAGTRFWSNTEDSEGMKVYTAHLMASSNSPDEWVAEVIVDKSVTPEGDTVALYKTDYPAMSAQFCLSDSTGRISSVCSSAAWQCTNNSMVVREVIRSNNESAPYRNRPGGFFQCRFPAELQGRVYEQWEGKRRERILWERKGTGSIKQKYDAASDGIFRAFAVAYVKLMVEGSARNNVTVYEEAVPLCGFGGIFADGYNEEFTEGPGMIEGVPSNVTGREPWMASPHIVRRFTMFDILEETKSVKLRWANAWAEIDDVRKFIAPMDQDRGVKLGPALCVVTFDNDSYVLPEFIEYYRFMGVEKFFVYDRSVPSSDIIVTMLAHYIESGLVSYTSWPFPPFRKSVEERGNVWMRHSTYVQHTAIDDCLSVGAQRYMYFIHCDPDEFFAVRDPLEFAHDPGVLVTIAKAIQKQFDLGLDEYVPFDLLEKKEGQRLKSPWVMSVGFEEKLCCQCVDDGVKAPVSVGELYYLKQSNDTIASLVGQKPALKFMQLTHQVCCRPFAVEHRRKLMLSVVLLVAWRLLIARLEVADVQIISVPPPSETATSRPASVPATVFSSSPQFFNTLGEFRAEGSYSRYDDGFRGWESPDLFLFSRFPEPLQSINIHEVRFEDMPDHLFNPSVIAAPRYVQRKWPNAAYLATFRYQSNHNLASRCEQYGYDIGREVAGVLEKPQQMIFVLDAEFELVSRRRIDLPSVDRPIGFACNESAFIDPHLVGHRETGDVFVSFLCRGYNPRRRDHMGPYKSVFARLVLSLDETEKEDQPTIAVAALDESSSYIYELEERRFIRDQFAGRNHVFFWPTADEGPDGEAEDKRLQLKIISHLNPHVEGDFFISNVGEAGTSIESDSDLSAFRQKKGGWFDFHLSGGALLPFQMSNTETCLLGLIHRHLQSRPNYVHAFFCLSMTLPREVTRLSREFCFPAPPHENDKSGNSTCEVIQFASAPLFARDSEGDTDADVLVPFGVNDCLSRVMRISADAVRGMLREATHDTLKEAINVKLAHDEAAKS